MLKAEYQQEQRVRENAANCEQLQSELEKIQRRQRELDRQRRSRTTERAAAGSRPESRMEVAAEGVVRYPLHSRHVLIFSLLVGLRVHP